MTTTTKKKNQTAAKAAPKLSPDDERLQEAYEVHTLAQLLFAQIATMHPWIMSSVSPMESRFSGLGWPSAGMAAQYPAMQYPMMPTIQGFPKIQT